MFQQALEEACLQESGCFCCRQLRVHGCLHALRQLSCTAARLPLLQRDMPYLQHAAAAAWLQTRWTPRLHLLATLAGRLLFTRRFTVDLHCESCAVSQAGSASSHVWCTPFIEGPRKLPDPPKRWAKQCLGS